MAVWWNLARLRLRSLSIDMFVRQSGAVNNDDGNVQIDDDI